MIGALALASLLVAQAPAASATDARTERLSKGEVLVWNDGKGTVLANAVIDAPPEKLWPIIWDCGNYKTTMKGIKDSTLVKDDGDVRLCKVTADLPFPLPDLTSTTRTERKVDPGKRWTRDWKMVEGDYEKNEGQWRLEPFGDGTRTLVTYRLLAVPKIPVPESVQNKMQQKALPDMIDHLRAQVARSK